MTSPLDKFISRYGRLPTEFDSDYLEMLRMGKYRVLEVPDVSPGKCGNCGASKNDGRKYVDIGLHIDWYGALYLCTLCLKDIAQTAGLFSNLEEQKNTLQILVDDGEDLRKQGFALHDTVMRTLEEVKDYYDRLPADRKPNMESSDDTDSNLVPEESASKPALNETKRSATKSTASSGRTNVRRFTDLLDGSEK